MANGNRVTQDVQWPDSGLDNLGSIVDMGKGIFSSPWYAYWLCPFQPPIQQVQEGLSPAVRQQWHQADYSSAYSAEVKNGCDVHPFLICLHGMLLNYIIKDGNDFTLMLWPLYPSYLLDRKMDRPQTCSGHCE